MNKAEGSAYPPGRSMRRIATTLDVLLAGLAVLCLAVAPERARAFPVAYDGFDYATGVLSGQNGGIGDWKNPWSGDSSIIVMSPGYTYTDSKSIPLDVVGNHIEIDADYGSVKTVNRYFNQTLGTITETFWMGAIIDGSTGSDIHNVSLGVGVYFGQGGKVTGSTTWQLSDQDGLVADTGIDASGSAFLVIRVDFMAGDEQAWLWVNPDLDVEPDLALADATCFVKAFESDFAQIQL